MNVNMFVIIWPGFLNDTKTWCFWTNCFLFFLCKVSSGTPSGPPSGGLLPYSYVLVSQGSAEVSRQQRGLIRGREFRGGYRILEGGGGPGNC